MNVTFPPSILEAGNADLQFLKSLDGRIHEEPYDMTLRANISGHSRRMKIRHSNLDVKISSPEMERVLGLVNDETKLVLVPTNTNWGFNVGYNIQYAGTSRQDLLLSINEHQLPREYDFDKMSETFMRGDNIQRIKKLRDLGIWTIGMPVKDYGHYEY
ncbi:hypothetical protein KW787_00230 [Candidatus Pacearchaeota archaeon]|nr:hypothetical protein [Candidatus Pacearchaeota archaeon]